MKEIEELNLGISLCFQVRNFRINTDCFCKCIERNIWQILNILS